MAKTNQAAKSVIKAFWELDSNISVQEFIKEAESADIRCFVISDRVVASMKRQGIDGEFRSSLYRGEKSEKIKLTLREQGPAIQPAKAMGLRIAGKAMGLRIAGVDMVYSSRGPVVIEVNSSPGLEEIEKVTEIDVTSKIIYFLTK